LEANGRDIMTIAAIIKNLHYLVWTTSCKDSKNL